MWLMNHSHGGGMAEQQCFYSLSWIAILWQIWELFRKYFPIFVHWGVAASSTRRDSNMYRTCCFALYYPLTSLRKKHQRGVMDSLGPWNIIWTLMWKFRCCSQKIFLVLMLPWDSLIGVTESHWSSLCLAAVQETSCILTFNLSDLCCFQLCLDRTSMWRVELQTTTQSQL